MSKFYFLILFCLNSIAVNFCIEDADNSPFISATSDNKPQGKLVELVKTAMSNVGGDYKFQVMPWKRCLRDLENGTIDASFALVWSKDRNSKYVYPMIKNQPDNSKSIWDAKYKVFKSKDSKLEYKNGKFFNVKLGVDAPPGYIVREMIEKQKVATPRSHLPEVGLSLMLKNRVDGYIVNEEIGVDILNRLNQLNNYQILDETYYETSWFVVFSNKFYKNKPELVSKFWNEIAKLKK